LAAGVISIELYIYWRVLPADAQAACQALRAWQLAIEAQVPGLQARLLKRADAAAGDATLMETYTLAGGIGPALQQEIVDGGDTVSSPWRRGPRHVELFTEPA
jgi:Domain of unknown function (DUF4936)